MTFKITIEVPDSKLVSVLKLIGQFKPQVEGSAPVYDKPVNGKKYAKMNHSTVLYLGDIEKANEGTLSHQICELIQHHEKKNGVGGGMTRGLLLDSLEGACAHPTAAVKAAVASGIIQRKPHE